MKKRNLVPCLAIALSLGVILAGCSQQNTEGSPEPESLVQQDGSSQMTEEEPLPDGIEEGEKVEPDPGVEVPESSSFPEITAPAPSAAEYRERYPGDPDGMIQFYVVDLQGDPVQNARLGFTSEEAYAKTDRINTEMGTDDTPSEDFAVRINASGIAEAGLIEFDPSTGQVQNGLPQNIEVRVTQRSADGQWVDSTQWVTLTWENTVPSYTIQIDQPNIYAGYAEAEDRIQIALTQNGEPAAGVFVRLRDQDQKATPDYGGLQLDSYTGFTDHHGILYLTKVPDGTYKVYAGTIGRQQVLSSIEITEQNRILEMALPYEAQQ